MKISGSKFRSILFALFFLIIGIFLLRQPRVQQTQLVQWADRFFVSVTNPFSRFVLGSRDFVVGTWKRYFFLVRVEKENESLKKEIADVQQENLFLRSLQDENERLRKLFSFHEKLKGTWIGAHVIAYPPTGSYRVMTLDRGSDDGVSMRSPVVSIGGLVGQVTRIYPSKCQVLLMTDPTSAVDVRLQNTGARGLVIGKTSKLDLSRDLYIGAFEYLNQAVTVEEGATVVTSGLDGVYPADILVGYVHGAKKKKYDIFLEAEVIPAVDFYQIREVLIRTKP